MNWLATITVVGLVVLAGLIWLFFRTRTADLIDEMLQKRKATSKLAVRGQYVEGIECIPVALALTEECFYYENPDLQASFELNRIDEVEYDDELATGRSAPHGMRVLRMRSHGTPFEFLLPEAEVSKWMEALPPRRPGEASRASA
ncbi:MAG TPA: hypothetical protein VNL91_01950 [Thermoanaerobaculia bacterium]|nr:hypothetical protein [Thermoanaerobaculia bacterium]